MLIPKATILPLKFLLLMHSYLMQSSNLLFLVYRLQLNYSGKRWNFYQLHTNRLSELVDYSEVHLLKSAAQYN
jgi:hypothetical protein